MPIDTMQKESLILMSLFLGNKDREKLGYTAKLFKNLDIEKALCSESVTIDGYLLNKIRLYTLPDTTNQDIDQPRAEASATAIKELVIAPDAAKHLTNDDLTKLAKLGFVHNKTETINLCECIQITDLSPLASYTALTNLNLQECHITDLSPLASYTALDNLNLSYCEITDLIPLSSCKKLTSLNLEFCDEITDLSPLASCTALTSLNLGDCNQITDLSPLQSCTALKWLDFSACHRITDLSPLTSCVALKKLNLSFCDQLTHKLSPLANHPTLSELIGPDGDEVDLTSLSNTQQPGP